MNNTNEKGGTKERLVSRIKFVGLHAHSGFS
jgi:hypothetical protein